MSAENPFIEEEEAEGQEQELEVIPPDEIPEEESQEESFPAASGGSGLLKPVDIDEVVGLYEQFGELKSRLLNSDDLTNIQGSPHVNKSGWRKIATAFNVSIEVEDVEIEVEDGIVIARAKAVATAPNDKRSSAFGTCASNESNHMEKLSDNKNADIDEFMGGREGEAIWVDNAWRRLKPPKEVNEHNIVATAETRAKNRAISDLVGGGEVSAEEMGAEILDI